MHAFIQIFFIIQIVARTTKIMSPTDSLYALYFWFLNMNTFVTKFTFDFHVYKHRHRHVLCFQMHVHIYISDGLRIRLVHFIILCFQFLYGLDVSNCTIYSSTYISCDDEHLVVRTLPPHLFMKKCSLSTNTEWKKIIDQNKIEKRNTVQREELSVLIKAYKHIDGYVYVCECVTTALLLPLLLFVDNKTLPVRMMWNNANETQASKRRLLIEKSYKLVFGIEEENRTILMKNDNNFTIVKSLST